MLVSLQAGKLLALKPTIECQMKKVPCLHGAVDNVEMGEEELFQNSHLAPNFLVSLLKKHKKHIERFTKTDWR